MTHLLKLKNLCQKYGSSFLGDYIFTPETPAEKHHDVSKWDPTFQIPAYIRRANKGKTHI